MSKKGENIYKRKDNRWEGRYIKCYKEDGTPHFGYCYAKTYREVKEKLAAQKLAHLSGQTSFSPPQKRRFSYYCDEWLLLNRKGIKESTYVKYRTSVEKHIKPRLGSYLVPSLSSAIIEQFCHALLYEEKLAPKSVKDILVILQSILKYTSKFFTTSMPIIEIVYPKVPQGEIRVLTREEQNTFIQYLLSDMDAVKFGVLLTLMTGMRIGEICALRWKNISLEEKTILINATMQRLSDTEETNTHKTKIVITEPKSAKSIRLIPLTENMVNLCKSQQCLDPDAFVLTGDSKRFMEPRALQYRLKKYTKECGLSGVHYHTLRHTFATRCVEVDFEIKSLSEILGHSSPRVTLERYIHPSMELKRSNMDKLTAIGF